MTLNLDISAVSLLAETLMSEESVTPHDGQCQKIIAERLTKIGFNCEHLRFGNVDNLFARMGNESPLILFAGHTDVVPPGPLGDWISPPFEPEIRDGYLYGRGASDMKAAIAAMIVAVDTFIKKNRDFNGSIGFLITSDEEGPSIHGTKEVINVLEARGEKIDYCIVGEPSSEKELGDQIRIGRRGSLSGRLVIHGKQGHVAHPHLAKNPIHMSMLALNDLAQTEWDKGNQNFPPTTFQISNIHAGTGAFNVIPGHLEVAFNFRFGTAVGKEQLEERVEEILRKYHLDFDLTFELGAKPFLTKKGKLIPATEETIFEILGRKPKLSTGGGTSDARFIAETGAEIVELGVSHATAHHVNECVRILDIELLVDCYQRILQKLLS